MPVVSDLEAFRKLKRTMPTVPIILFSQYADVGNGLIAAGLLVDQIVSKADVRNLIEHVRSLIPV
jgi:hypothetical protein